MGNKSSEHTSEKQQQRDKYGNGKALGKLDICLLYKSVNTMIKKPT
jgi:hypothetical protein